MHASGALTPACHPYDLLKTHSYFPANRTRPTLINDSLIHPHAASAPMKEALGNEPTYRIIGLAIQVHKHLGPGLLEKV